MSASVVIGELRAVRPKLHLFHSRGVCGAEKQAASCLLRRRRRAPNAKR